MHDQNVSQIIVINYTFSYSLKYEFLLDMGKDKLAEVIQWGRDHGLPTYTQVRQFLLNQKKKSSK